MTTTRSYRLEDVALKVGDRVTINPDSPWRAAESEIVERYRGVVGEVVDVRHDGIEALVRYPDGTHWAALALAFTREGATPCR